MAASHYEVENGILYPITDATIRRKDELNIITFESPSKYYQRVFQTSEEMMAYWRDLAIWISRR